MHLHHGLVQAGQDDLVDPVVLPLERALAPCREAAADVGHFVRRHEAIAHGGDERVLVVAVGGAVGRDRSTRDRRKDCKPQESFHANSRTTRRLRALFFSILATRKAPISRVLATWVPPHACKSTPSIS